LSPHAGDRKAIMTANNAVTAADPLSPSVRRLLESVDGLALNAKGQLEGKGVSFVQTSSDEDVPPVPGLATIARMQRLFYLVPAAVDLPAHLEGRRHRVISDADILANGIAAGAGDAPLTADKIPAALEDYSGATMQARQARRARQELERNRTGAKPLFAGALPIEPTAPMLVEGLVRQSGVSVFYGAFDEFKTTLLLDMAVHIAMGATWQGRKVAPRPVIWYALEGSDEIPVRVRALTAKLSGKQTAWGDDFAPIVVRDRIPEDPIAWRTEIAKLGQAISSHLEARQQLGEIEHFTAYNGAAPLVVVDTLSIALGGEDEKGPRAAGFISACLDLLKERDDLGVPDSVFFNDYPDATEEWLKQNPGRINSIYIHDPVAEHVLIAHHTTKTGTDFGGHRSIGADTHGLYRIHRFGSMANPDRPYAGQLTPLRVKGMARPAPIRFNVEVVKVEGTEQTAAILRDKVAEIPAELAPIIEALRELENPDAIAPSDLNACLDQVAGADGRSDAAKRQARKRIRDQLEAAGVIEPIENDGGKAVSYRFHDTNVA
jgi:hypothetical protein